MERTDFIDPARALSECSVALSQCRDQGRAAELVSTHAARALGADSAAVVLRGELVAGADDIPPDLPRISGTVELLGTRYPHGLVALLEPDGYLLLQRAERPFRPEEGLVLHGFAGALRLRLDGLRSVRSDTHGTGRSTEFHTLIERERLLERLTRIQRSISHRAPLQEVLDAICVGAKQLLGDEVVGLRLLDALDPRYLEIVAVSGLPEDLVPAIRRTPVGVGAGGRSVAENRLVVLYDYAKRTDVLKALADKGLQSAMAAPVHERGEPVGSLVVASYQPGRRYSQVEQEVLLAFAEHVSLAITDARTVEALREAQRVKEMFLAMVSHELKTPLTAIMGTLRTFERHHDTIPPDLRSAMLDSAIDRGEHLAHLINRLLQGARAELAGAEQEVALSELVSETIMPFADSCPLVVEPLPETRLVVDATSLQAALGILMENAIAHSPEGSEVRVLTKVGENVTISVLNKGELPAGIDASELFQPFQRGDDASSPGVGLGLYIASRLAAAIDGRIDVRSGGGEVEFRISFPLKAPHLLEG